MLELPPTSWDTQLLDHSLVPLLEPAGGVRPMLMLMLMPMLSSMEDSPPLTMLPPLQATLLEPLALSRLLLLQLLPLSAHLPSAIRLLLLPSAMLLHLLLLLLLLLLTTSPLSARKSSGGSAGASPSHPSHRPNS